jgi:predicted enzyme related to lactoylglutathione lyase
LPDPAEYSDACEAVKRLDATLGLPTIAGASEHFAVEEEPMTEIKWLDHGVVPTNDLGRAVLFYTRVLGAEIEEIKNVDTTTIGEIRSKGRGMMRCFMRLGPTRFGVFLQHKDLPAADRRGPRQGARRPQHRRREI